MNTKWSLDAIYKSYQDPELKKDLQSLQDSIKEGADLCDQLSHADDRKACNAILIFLEHQYVLELKLMHYCTLRQACDTTDSETAALLEKINKIISKNSKTSARMQRFIAEIKDLDAVIKGDSFLEEYAYLLQQIKVDGAYLLTDEAEEVIAKLNISGAHAWADLYDYITSDIDIPFEDEVLTLSSIRNKAYDADASIRKKAYEAELKAYAKIEDAVAFSLNSIKAQVISECELRGYSSVLDKTLQQSHMQRETLDALITTIKEYLPVFQSYLKRKAHILGYTNGLPWYELFAPLGSDDQQFSIAEAKAYLLTHFRPFADDLADMIEDAFTHEWIDFLPHKGKVGGAFCQNIPYIKQSRILTNYGESLGDVVTLAHELGHAYHGQMIEDHRILNMDYSMPVAETASTFNENIIMNAAIAQSKPEAKVALIENQLQDVTQTICDIYSRYVFETTIFEKRKDGFLFANDIKTIMLDAQREAYGDALDPAYLHPYMWVSKSHYYTESLSFYNFPYAFGSLLARGLYVKYQSMGDAFLDKYRAFLKATTVSTVEDAAKIMDINLTSKDFWEHCLETCRNQIQDFIKLTD